MSKDWNESQQLAIAARQGTVVVSAAAGSGKTTVLIERIMQMILLKVKPWVVVYMMRLQLLTFRQFIMRMQCLYAGKMVMLRILVR